MSEVLLTLDKVSKAFGALKATDSVSLDVMAGEIHAIIGPNGAGKTTLINQISGLLPVDSGLIRFAGGDITGLPPGRRALLGLGRTFQISSLIPGFSALANVKLAVQAHQGHSYRFVRPVRSDDSLNVPARNCLDRVGLGHRADVAVAALSHGERRQLELAVALALEPRILLLDEPMAGLGPEDTKQMITALDGLRAELAMLLIEHDMDAVFALADRISVLVYGKVIASDTPDAIRRSKDVRAAYLGDHD